MVAVTEDSYKRHIAYLVLSRTSRASETEYATHMYQHKRTKTVSDNEQSFSYSVTKWGLPKLESSNEL